MQEHPKEKAYPFSIQATNSPEREKEEIVTLQFFLSNEFPLFFLYLILCVVKKSYDTYLLENLGKNEEKNGSRFYDHVKLIIGNTCQWMATIPKKSPKDPKGCHKWLVYLRFEEKEEHALQKIDKVRFFLHPSYKPNDVVEVEQPPFQLYRYGYGEFPIRVQIHFKDSRNKPADFIHQIVLDKTMCGLQMFGAETTVSLQLAKEVGHVQEVVDVKPNITSTNLESVVFSWSEKDLEIKSGTPGNLNLMRNDCLDLSQCKSLEPSSTNVPDREEICRNLLNAVNLFPFFKVPGKFFSHINYRIVKDLQEWNNLPYITQKSIEVCFFFVSR